MPQWRACPEWDEVSSELALEMNLTVHLGSMFLGVHLDSTFVLTSSEGKVTGVKNNLAGAVDL